MVAAEFRSDTGRTARVFSEPARCDLWQTKITTGPLALMPLAQETCSTLYISIDLDALTFDVSGSFAVGWLDTQVHANL